MSNIFNLITRATVLKLLEIIVVLYKYFHLFIFFAVRRLKNKIELKLTNASVQFIFLNELRWRTINLIFFFLRGSLVTLQIHVRRARLPKIRFSFKKKISTMSLLRVFMSLSVMRRQFNFTNLKIMSSTSFEIYIYTHKRIDGKIIEITNVKDFPSIKKRVCEI